MRQAAIAYQNLVLARASMAISDQLATDASTFQMIASARAEVGLGSGADVARAQTELARAEQTRIRARAGWEDTSIHLATMLRWPTNVLIDPDQDDIHAIALISNADTERLVQSATSSRPDLRAAEKRATAASKENTAAWWDLLGPDLDVGVRERFIATDDKSLDDTFIAYAFVGFSFDFSEAGRIRSASGKKHSMEIRAEALSEQVRADVHRALSQVRAARAAIPQARIEVESAERGYAIQRDRFEAGTGLGLEIIEAQNAKARARLSAVEAVLRLNAAQVALAAATGHLTPDLFE
jgi:outer membrane protein TolC